MCTYVVHADMHESFRRQSGAMYCMLAKGALLGPQNPSEMGLMRGSKSLAFWGRGGPFRWGGPNRSYTGSNDEPGIKTDFFFNHGCVF